MYVVEKCSIKIFKNQKSFSYGRDSLVNQKFSKVPKEKFEQKERRSVCFIFIRSWIVYQKKSEKNSFPRKGFIFIFQTYIFFKNSKFPNKRTIQPVRLLYVCPMCCARPQNYYHQMTCFSFCSYIYNNLQTNQKT